MTPEQVDQILRALSEAANQVLGWMVNRTIVEAVVWVIINLIVLSVFWLVSHYWSKFNNTYKNTNYNKERGLWDSVDDEMWYWLSVLFLWACRFISIIITATRIGVHLIALLSPQAQTVLNIVEMIK